MWHWTAFRIVLVTWNTDHQPGNTVAETQVLKLAMDNLEVETEAAEDGR